MLVVTVGAMFAASILLGRALQPVELMVGNWRNLNSARSAYERIKKLLSANPPADARLALPRPLGSDARAASVFGLAGVETGEGTAAGRGVGAAPLNSARISSTEASRSACTSLSNPSSRCSRGCGDHRSSRSWFCR